MLLSGAYFTFKFRKCSFVLFLLVSLGSTSATAQLLAGDTNYVAVDTLEMENESLPNWYRGGNIGARVGNPTYVEISPFIAKRFTQKISAGIGVNYIYYREKVSNKTYNSNIIGLRFFSRYHLLSTLFAHAEYEVLRTSYYDIRQDNHKKRWIGSPFCGLGYSLPVTNTSAFTFMGLYNFNFKPVYSPYNSAFVVRAGFVF